LRVGRRERRREPRSGGTRPHGGRQAAIRADRRGGTRSVVVGVPRTSAPLSRGIQLPARHAVVLVPPEANAQGRRGGAQAQSTTERGTHRARIAATRARSLS